MDANWPLFLAPSASTSFAEIMDNAGMSIGR